MRKVFFFLAGILIYNTGFCQNLSYQQRLYYTGKIWGFVKYYHSEVSTCKVNWDSVLIAVLPGVKNASSSGEFNDALVQMLKAAGPMAIATSTFNDNLAPELKRNRDFSWLNDSALRSDVRGKLDTIRTNFRPHDICWVKNNDYTGSYQGWLEFPFDQLKISTTINYPDESHRLLVLFKYWNIIRYFNPFNYVLDRPVDSILYLSVSDFANAPDALHLYESLLRLAAQLNDAHVGALTYSTKFTFPYRGYYFPHLILKYIEGHYVVVKSDVSDINVGDAILSVDGRTVEQWEDSLRPYVSAGNVSVFRRQMQQYLIAGLYGSAAAIKYLDDDGNVKSTTAYRTGYLSDGWYPEYYYPADSLTSIKWTILDCNAGYVNMGNLQKDDVDAMYNAMATKPVLVFDLRNYPNATAWPIANLMYANPKVFSSGILPDVTYPGTYSFQYDYLGKNGNQNPYRGKIILLINEETQSQAEYSCMILQAIPGTTTVGSQTAGADGNVSYFNLTDDIQVGYTSLGIYYPDNSPTQRIGIKPDILVSPTRKGVSEGRDEVLDKALELACKISGMAEQNPAAEMHIYPNPVNSILTIEAQWPHSASVEITVQDMLGKTIITQQAGIRNNMLNEKLDVNALHGGTYIVTMKGSDAVANIKFIKY